jgi:hypothetical protein
MEKNAGSPAILWLRNDLRLHDNYALVLAAKMVESGQAAYALPVYCYDPRHFSTTTIGLKERRTDCFRAKFLTESLADLRTGLQSIGSDLTIIFGRPEAVIPHIMSEIGAKTVIAQPEVAWEDRLVEDALIAAAQSAGGTVDFAWGSTLYHLDDLPFSASFSASTPDITPSSPPSTTDPAPASSLSSTPASTARPSPASDLATFPSSRGAFTVQVTPPLPHRTHTRSHAFARTRAHHRLTIAKPAAAAAQVERYCRVRPLVPAPLPGALGAGAPGGRAAAEAGCARGGFPAVTDLDRPARLEVQP